MDYLLILLVVFGIILLISLIILVVRLNFTINKIDYIIDDILKKLKTVNHAFEVVDKVTDSVSLINDRLVDLVATFIASLFAKRKKVEKNEEEEY